MLESTKQARIAIEKIARENGVTIFEVRREIEKAIEEGMKSTEPNAIRFWHSIPRQGITPTPEEAIMYIAHIVK